MTEKRFKLHIKWYNIEKTEGEATLTDNGQPLIETEQITDARLLKNILNGLYNENEQLKQRNTNQYNQLNELWQIIEEENWEKLIAMKKQLKEDEERLQREWKCYE